MHISLLTELEYICNLAMNLYKIPVYVLNSKGQLLVEKTAIKLPNHPVILKKNIFDKIFSDDQIDTVPSLSEINYFENYFFINIIINEQFEGKLIMGPVLFERIPEEILRGINNDLNSTLSKKDLTNYYNSLVIISRMDFIYISHTLYYMLYQKQLDLIESHKKYLLIDVAPSTLEQPDVYISKQRQKPNHDRDFLFEKRLFSCIKEGKKAELLSLFLLNTSVPGVLAKESYLRSQKNLTISGITLATRAAVEGGLNPELAYALSDLYIQKLEGIYNSNDIAQLTKTVFLDFTERVAKGIKYNYSNPINLCQNYIYSNLYDNIKLASLAELVGLNANYLSNLFKKEVGISITSYIHKTKISEAKYLITFTNQSLSQISTLLNFHDQSHFSKTFKKYTGTTPKQFKRGVIQNN